MYEIRVVVRQYVAMGGNMSKGPLGAAELERLAATLRGMRGTDAYPPTAEKLLEIAGVQVEPAELSKPGATKYVRTTTKKPSSRSPRKGAPPKKPPKQRIPTDYAAGLVFLPEDADHVAASDRLIQHLLATARTPATHVAAPSTLWGLVPGPLADKVRSYLKGCIESEQLPTGVGMVRIGNGWKLFLLADMRAGSRLPEAVKQETTTEPFSEAFAEAFDEIDRRTGKRNYVLLHDLRQRLAMIPRPDFDAGLNELRRSQKYSLDSADGRHGRLTPEQVDAGIREAGSVLVYVARR